MRSVSNRLWGRVCMLALILFVPAWFIGENNHDPEWWKWVNFQKWSDRDVPILIYVWPYFKSLPLQIGMIYGLIWLMNRRKKE